MAISSNSLDELLKAIDIIATQRANENNAYDQTIICTITDNSKAEQYGYYTVTNDTITFEAYSDNPDYKVGNYVRVSIPNGDYAQQKYITGLYQYNNGEVISYVSPLDTFMDVGVLVDNRAPQNNELVIKPSMGLIANGGAANYQYLEKAALESGNWQLDSSQSLLQASGIYDTIGLQADFKCRVGANKDIRSGSYGIELELIIQLNENQKVTHTVRLDSADFFGDPYNFKVYSTQAQAYDISNLGGTVVGFNVKPYQRDDFMIYDGKELIKLSPADFPDIFVSNIYVALGCDLYKIANHNIKLYTTDSLEYKHEATDFDLDIVNKKILSVLWYNKDENHKYIGFSDGKIGDYDEVAYLEEVSEDNRLRSQQSDKVYNTFGALDAADRYYKALPLIKKTIGYVENSIVKKLSAFKRDLTGFSIAQNAVNGWITDLKNNIQTAKEQEQIFIAWEKNLVQSDWYNYKYGDVVSALQDLLKVISGTLFTEDKAFAPGIKEAVIAEYINYRGIYESYANDMMQLLEEYELLYVQAFEQLTLLKSACENKNNIPFIAKDFSNYDNHYDIFWYRYNPDYNEPDNFMESGWEPFDTIPNKSGLPVEEDSDNPGYLIKNCPNERNAVEVMLDKDTHTEKFMVVIVQNHNVFYSNELIFTNADEFADESTLTSDAIYITHGKNSRENYQMLYSSGYQLLNQSDAKIDRELSICCKNEYGGNHVLSGATLYWYIPTTSTMLFYDEEDLSGENGRGFGVIKEQDPEISEEDKLTELPDGENVEATDPHYKYFKPGYRCFYKKLDDYPEDDASEEMVETWEKKLVEDLKFYYHIKEYLVPCNLRNEIECLVVIANETDKAELLTSIRIVFGALGTNGTNYTLIVMPATTQYCVTGNDVSGGMPITAALYDYDGNEVEGANIQYLWNDPKTGEHIPTNYGLMDPHEDKPYGTKIIYNQNGSTGVGILTVGVSAFEIKDNEGNKIGDDNSIDTTMQSESESSSGRTRYVDLFMQYPVPWGSNPAYYIAGATSIIYNSNGANPEYYKGPYVLYDENHKPVEGVTWDMEWYDSEQKKIEPGHSAYDFYKNYMPVLSNRNTIIPSPIYISGCQCYPVVVANKGGEVWRQPILINQNRYPSKYLNAWDGSLVIDKENGTIMANLIGAGKKETDNSFSGVLMGEVENVEIDTGRDAVLNRNHSGVGLYGFHHGKQSFGFNVDGTAFIGKSGGGRISFDGNQGFIYSDNWLQSFMEQVEESTGEVDPDTGEEIKEIKTKFKKSDNKPFNPVRESEDSDNVLYYELGEGEDGMAIDLRSGHIDANNFRLRSENIKMSSGKSLDDENKYIVNIETSPMMVELTAANAFDKNEIYYIFDEEKGQYVQFEGESFEDGVKYYKTKIYLRRNNDASFPGFDGRDYYVIENGEYRKLEPNEYSEYPKQRLLYEKIVTTTYVEVPNSVNFPYKDQEGNYIICYTKATDNNGNDIYTEYAYEGDPPAYPDGVTLYRVSTQHTKYESRTEEEFAENPDTTYYEFDEENGYVEYKKSIYPTSVILYELVDRKHGYYHIRFDKYGNLELNIADTTFMADSGITIKDYFENLNSEIIRIEDEVIGLPPDLKSVPIFDHFTSQIVDIEDNLIGHPGDVQPGSLYSYINAQQYLTTEGVFEGLTNNGKNLGIFPVYEYTTDNSGNSILVYDEFGNPVIKEFYINASYISTGILRSPNWDGRLQYHYSDGSVSPYLTDEEAWALVNDPNNEVTWDGEWSLIAVDGTYWDLNNSQLWASNFELNAWKNLEYTTDEDGAITGVESSAAAGGLYLNSKPAEDGYYLSIGQLAYDTNEDGSVLIDNETGKPVISEDSHFIQYYADGSLLMQLNSFALNAWGYKYDESGNKISYGGVVVDSDPSAPNHTGYWLSVGSSEVVLEIDESGAEVEKFINGNFIQFDKNNNLIVQIATGKFELNAWNEDNIGVSEGIYINSQGREVKYTNGAETVEDKIYFRAGWGNEYSTEADLSNVFEISKNRILIGAKNFILDAYDHSHQAKDGSGKIDKVSYDALTDDKKEAYEDKEIGGIYLNSDPHVYSQGDYTGYDSYLYMGNTEHFIQYTGDHKLLMNLNRFTLDAFDDSQGIYLKSHPDIGYNADGTSKDYYFIFGKGNNFIQMDSNGKFIIQTNDEFTLNAWDNKTNSGVYLASNPSAVIESDDTKYQFIIGHPDSGFIKYGEAGLFITVQNLVISNKNILDYVTGISDATIKEFLNNGNVDGIIADGNTYYVSVSYLTVKDGEDTLFLADGTKETGPQVQIAGWDVTSSGFISPSGSMTMGIEGIFCKAVANENLQDYVTLQYGIHNGVNNTDVEDENALTADIKDYGADDAWYNYTYKILSDNSFTVKLISTITTSLVEFYIITEDQLPSAASSTMKYTFCKKAVSSITVPKGQKNKYLIVNYMYGIDSILQPSASTASFELTPSKGLKAVGANITGTITANWLTANKGGSIGGWEINEGGLVYYADGSDAVVAGLLLPGNEIIAGKSSFGGAPSDYYNWGIILGNNFAVDYTKGLFTNLGNIGGWTIGASTLSAGNVTLTSSTSSTATVINVNNKFKVTNAGKLTATNASITGDITASSGQIGSWIIRDLKYYPNKSDNLILTEDYVSMASLYSSYYVYIEPPSGFQDLPVLDFTETCYITPFGIIFKLSGNSLPATVNELEGFFPWHAILGSLSPLPLDGYWEGL